MRLATENNQLEGCLGQAYVVYQIADTYIEFDIWATFKQNLGFAWNQWWHTVSASLLKLRG